MKELLSHLAAAFGGHSQYSVTDVGNAIAGQIANNGWADTPEAYASEAAGRLAEIWDGQGASPEQDAAAILSAIIARNFVTV